MLPGLLDTETLYLRSVAMAQASGTLVEQVHRQRTQPIPAGRFGDPAEFGDAHAYLCSTQASFVTGMNFLIDGGACP